MWLLGAGSGAGSAAGGGLAGKKQTCYLVMGTPFLLNGMIAVAELWRGLHSLWRASWSPETPAGLGLVCEERAVRQGGREREMKGVMRAAGREGQQGVGERGQGGEPRHEEKDPEGGGQMESKGWKQ